MPAESGDIRALPLTDRASGRTITRLQYRGWFVDVDATVVSVPRQIVTDQHPQDLQVCLAAAHTLARNNVRTATRAPAPSAPRPTAPDVLITLLRDARSIAETRWHPDNFDIYICTRTAWEETVYDVPFTDVLRALRRVLEPGTDLTEFSATARGRTAIVALYDAAIAALIQSTGDARGAA